MIMMCFDYFSVMITSTLSPLTFDLVTTTSPSVVWSRDISQVYLDDTMALCVSSYISLWSGGATPLKRLPLGGSDRITRRLKI